MIKQKRRRVRYLANRQQSVRMAA